MSAAASPRPILFVISKYLTAGCNNRRSQFTLSTPFSVHLHSFQVCCCSPECSSRFIYGLPADASWEYPFKYST